MWAMASETLRPPWRRVARLAGRVTLAVWALAALAIVVFSVAPRLFGYRTLIVRSGSMEPAIRTGGVVLVEPVPPQRLKPGDVITYERDGAASATGRAQVVTHRIVGIVDGAPPRFRTQGDANNAPDAELASYQDLGWRVVASMPYAGYLLNALAYPAARALLYAVPALLLAASIAPGARRGLG
jgi:signal peptidase